MSTDCCFSDAIDSVLDARDCSGANIRPVSIIERRWSGRRVGDGEFTDKEIPMKPTPSINNIPLNIVLTRAGASLNGGLILKSISKNKFSEDDLRTDTGINTFEKFIKVGKYFYRTKEIIEKIVTWDVILEKVSQDETERKY